MHLWVLSMAYVALKNLHFRRMLQRCEVDPMPQISFQRWLEDHYSISISSIQYKKEQGRLEKYTEWLLQLYSVIEDDYSEERTLVRPIVPNYIKNSVLIKQCYYWIWSERSLAQAWKICCGPLPPKMRLHDSIEVTISMLKNTDVIDKCNYHCSHCSFCYGIMHIGKSKSTYYGQWHS